MRASLCLLLLSACSNSRVLREPDEYTGCGTDEHWRTFNDQEPSAVIADATAPALTQPDLSAPLAGSPAPIFYWNQDANDVGMPLGDVQHDGVGCNNCCPEWQLGALGTAHLPPISGTVYDLQFSVGGTVSHRVVTTLQEWKASDALWTSWTGKTVSLRIFKLDLLHNDIAPGTGGPYVATHAFVFTVAP